MASRAMKPRVIWITAAALLAGTPAGRRGQVGLRDHRPTCVPGQVHYVPLGSAPQASLDLQTAPSALKGGKSRTGDPARLSSAQPAVRAGRLEVDAAA